MRGDRAHELGREARATRALSARSAGGRSRGRDGARSRGRGAARRGPRSPRRRRSAGRRRASRPRPRACGGAATRRPSTRRRDPRPARDPGAPAPLSDSLAAPSWRSSSSKAGCRSPARSCPPATRTRRCRFWPAASSPPRRSCCTTSAVIRDVEAMLALLADLGVRVERRGENTVSLRGDGAGKTAVDAVAGRADPRLLPGRRPAAGALRRGADAPARRRRHRPPPPGPAPGRLPRARRDRRARARHRHPGARRAACRPCDFFMDEPSVMGTENALMAAALIDGTTTIRNAASEPHVQDLARMLVKMGAAIEGIGSNVMTVHGLGRARRLRALRLARPHRDRLVHGARGRHRRRADDQGLRRRRPADDPARLPAARAAQRDDDGDCFVPGGQKLASSATPATTSPRSRTARGPRSRPTSRASRSRSPPSPRARC